MDKRDAISNKKIKFSVIIAVLNCAEYLEEALQSVFSQTYPDIEVIVIDGGSVDGTVDIIKKYDDKILFWISEKDGGTSEAFNKGFKRANGDFVVLMGADDWFINNNIFEYVSHILESNPQADVIHAPMLLVDRNTGKFICVWDSDIKGMARGMTIRLPGAFIKRSVAENRLLDVKFRYANDYDLFLYLLKTKKASFFRLDKIYLKFRTGGMSVDNKGTLIKCKEMFLIHKEYFGILHAVVRFPYTALCVIAVSMNFRPLRYLRRLRASWRSQY
ncbi:MAG: glycosyltransferase [Deltaproteobacteria bacterium]